MLPKMSCEENMTSGNEADSSVRKMKRVTSERARRTGTVADTLPINCVENISAFVLVGQGL